MPHTAQEMTLSVRLLVSSFVRNDFSKSAQGWLMLVQGGQGWSRMVKDSYGRSKMVKDGQG